MAEKFIYSVFDRQEEAHSALKTLNEAGIPSSALTLYAHDDLIERLEFNQDPPEIINTEAAKQEIDLTKYERELNEGSIVLAVTTNYQDKIKDINKDNLKPSYIEINENRYETAMDPFTDGDTADQIAQDIIDQTISDRPEDARAGGIDRDIPLNKSQRPQNLGDESYYAQGEQSNKEFQKQEKQKFQGVSDVKRPVTKPIQKPRYDRYEE